MAEAAITALRRLAPGTWRYGKWTISYNPKPIPASCGVDWDYVHDNYDGAPDANDDRHGNCASAVDCLAEIQGRDDYGLE